MKRLPLIAMLFSLAGCAGDPGPDVAVYDGPYYYDSGAYYEDPRTYQSDYDRRYFYGGTTIYPAPYPYYYRGGGYSRYRYNTPDRPDRDGRNDSGRGRERERTPADRPTADRPRVTPDRPQAIDRSRQLSPAPAARPSDNNGDRARQRPSAPPPVQRTSPNAGRGRRGD